MKNSKQKEPKLVAVYARSATAEKSKTGVSAQLVAIEKYARNNGYIIVKKYIDNGYSGVTLNRPGLNQLLADAKKKKWDLVLVRDLSRLSRSLPLHRTIKGQLDKKGIGIVVVATENMPKVVKRKTNNKIK